ncbi:MAG: small subunit ribosomal protein S4 [Candidatus Peregrinibacteria bacterium Gr01-1014_25]|nr:MAG: small subunit ribosomal protein S4 [Candidatus Peregrinibacteria bacterium Gr01-1014_25]
MRYTGPKARRCRRQEMNLYGSDKYDKILARKPHPPGKSPRGRLGRKSEYARQLMEKQRVRDMYGLSERQFRRLYAEAMRTKADTGDRMKQLLEQRLDNVIYRAGFAITRVQARQLAGHGHFLIDGVRVTCPSFRVRAGQNIAARPRSQQSTAFVEILRRHEKYMPPAWLKVDAGKLAVEVVGLPRPEDAEQAADMRQVVEFYSR